MRILDPTDERTPIARELSPRPAHLRTVALLDSSVGFLDSLGIWTELRAEAAPLKSLRLVLPIIRHHHEHSDGTGYPDGLRREEIPLLPRILQVVDVYDALRTARPYKPALTHQQAATTMLAEARNGLWDEDLVAEFFSMLEKRQVA